MHKKIYIYISKNYTRDVVPNFAKHKKYHQNMIFLCGTCTNYFDYRTFRLVLLVRCSFVFASSNCDWLKKITWFILATWFILCLIHIHFKHNYLGDGCGDWVVVARCRRGGRSWSSRRRRQSPGLPLAQSQRRREIWLHM